MGLRHFFIVCFLPLVCPAQEGRLDEHGHYHVRYKDGREAVLMEAFRYLSSRDSVSLAMTQNTCTEERSLRCVFTVEQDERYFSYRWTESPDPQQIGREVVSYFLFSQTPFDYYRYSTLGYSSTPKGMASMSLTCDHFRWFPRQEAEEERAVFAWVGQGPDSVEDFLLDRFGIPQYRFLARSVRLGYLSEDTYQILDMGSAIGSFSPYSDMEFVFQTPDPENPFCSVTFVHEGSRTRVRTNEGPPEEDDAYTPVVVDERDYSFSQGHIFIGGR